MLRRAVSLIVQLSDVHLLSAPEEQKPIFDGLIEAIEKTRARFGRPLDLLAMTGDVFDSVSVDRSRAVEAFTELHQRVMTAMGGAVPTIVIPGNHDRRRLGLLGPHRDDLFVYLSEALRDRAFVHGTTTPFLSALVPPELHGQPFFIIAYDSTYLPHGLVSAGGILRQEDLLHAASRMDGGHPDWPVLFMLHHHLVPTPLTDVGHIEAKDAPRIVQWTVKHVLPAVVANADREELTMTALGSGTALSTLHSLGRAVLVLHGHKHYATARHLDGMTAEQGDVLLVSAGSCGTAQPWHPTPNRDVARLWPSFNLIELDEVRAVVHTVAFGWKGTSAGSVVFRPMVNAHREGAKWKLLPLPPVVEEEEGPIVERNEASVRLSVSADYGPGRWDYRTTRALSPRAGMRPGRYFETIDAAEGARLLVGAALLEKALPQELELGLGGQTEFEVRGGLPRTLSEHQRLHGHRAAPFTSVGLMNRYRSDRAVLSLSGLGAAADDAFASMTHLGTGLERPTRLERGAGDTVEVRMSDCPPRTLLRIYWPLRREG